MDFAVVFLSYVVLFIIYGYYTKRYLKRNKFPGAYNGFIMGCILYYIVVPLLLLIFKSYYFQHTGDWRYSQIIQFAYGTNVGLGERMLAIGGLFIGLMGLNIGYRSKRRVRGNNNEPDSLDALVTTDYNDIIRKIGYVTLVLGGMAIIAYIVAFGGLSRTLQFAEALRQHYTSVSDYGVSSYNSYFLIMSGSLTITPLLFYLTWKNNHRQTDLIWCFVSAALATVYLLINSGKSAILRLFIIGFYMYLYEKKVKRKWIWFLIVIFLGLPFMDILDAIFAQNDILEAIRSFDYLYLLREFAIPTELNYNLNAITEKYGYMYFKNLITDFLDVLPGLQFESSFVNTSEFMRGSNWMRLGGTPNDVLTYGFLQCRYIGVFVIWFIWGYIAGWLDNMIERIGDTRGRLMLSMIVCMNVFSVITCADISSTLLYNLSFILIVMVLWLCSRKNNRERRKMRSDIDGYKYH